MSVTLYLTRTNEFREKKLLKYFIVVGVTFFSILFVIFTLNLINLFYLILTLIATSAVLTILYLVIYDNIKPFVKSEEYKIIIKENEIVVCNTNTQIIPKSDIDLLKIKLEEFYYKVWNGLFHVKLDGIKNSVELVYGKKTYKYSFYIESRNEFIRTKNSLVRLKQLGIISELNISDILKNKKYN